MKRLLAVAAVAFALSSTEAHAQLIGGPIGGPFGFNRGFLNVGAPNPGQMYGFAFPSANLQDRMPYFSLFPPTYYSYPVPRPYGYSPFAYPGFVQTPHPVVAQPLTMANPYVREPASPSDRLPDAGPSQPATQSPVQRVPMTSPSTNKTSGIEPSRKLNPFFDDPIVVRERR